MSGSVLPPDIREKISQQPPRGIGGGAMENAATAHQRDVAMNVPSPEEDHPSVETEDAEETVVRKKCPNTSCKREVEEAWNYCSACSSDLLRGGTESRLGLKLSEEDLSDYLFKGYISREVTILGKHKATMKSGQPKDLEEIDNYIMNGDWAKDAKGDDRKVSEFFMRQMNAMCQTAACVVKIDGESIGETMEKRMAWLMERGSAFVDILSQKVSLYNQALTDFLKKEENVLGS